MPFESEDGSSMIFQNFGTVLLHYMAAQPRRNAGFYYGSVELNFISIMYNVQKIRQGKLWNLHQNFD
jgi:hypothetical protein